MKAWRLHGFGDFRLEEAPVPQAEDGHVLVRVKVVQPSVTDTMVLKGRTVHSSVRIARALAEGKPIQRGHEFCAEVVELGKGVTSLRVGDRVSSGGEIACGQCRMCLAGRRTECLAPRLIGTDLPGAFAEYVSLPEAGLVKVPDGPSDNEVAAFQPLASCFGAVRAAELKLGESVVVLGQGPIGLGILQMAKLAGAGLLVGVDVRAENLELSRRYGANAVIDAREVDPLEAVQELTEGFGPDLVFDAGGGNPGHGLSGFTTIQQAFVMVRPRGKVIEASNLDGKMELDTVQMRIKKIRYIYPDLGDLDFLRAVAFLVSCGRVQVAPQITHVLHGLEKLGEAIEITENKAKYGATNPAQIVV